MNKYYVVYETCRADSPDFNGRDYRFISIKERANTEAGIKALEAQLLKELNEEGGFGPNDISSHANAIFYTIIPLKA